MAEKNIVAEEYGSESVKAPSVFKIDPVILTPEVVDHFRLNFEDPSEALARDLVSTMQMDYADQMEKDPNFLTYEGLIGGTAPFLEFLPSTKGKSPTERAFTADQAVVLFSNAQPASFARPFYQSFLSLYPQRKLLQRLPELQDQRSFPLLPQPVQPCSVLWAR